jgi:hypothetical protein
VRDLFSGSSLQPIEEAVLDSDRAMTLTLAPRTIAVPLGFGFLFLAVLAVRGHWGWASVLALVVAFVYGLVLERRLEFGDDALTLTPLLPLRGRQRFLWPDLGTPQFGGGYAGFGTIKIPISQGRYFFAGFIPRKSIDLTAIYQGASDRQALHPAELAALLQRSRLAFDAD